MSQSKALSKARRNGFGQGRKRLELKKIENDEALFICFSKRRNGLFSKASELSTLCGAELAIAVMSPAGKPHAFGCPNFNSVVNRFLLNGRAPAPGSDPDRARQEKEIMKDLNRQYMDLARRLDAAEERKAELKAQLKEEVETHEDFKWFDDLDHLGQHELERFEQLLQVVKSRLDARAEASQGTSSRFRLRGANLGSVLPWLSSSSNPTMVANQTTIMKSFSYALEQQRRPLNPSNQIVAPIRMVNPFEPKRSQPGRLNQAASSSFNPFRLESEQPILSNQVMANPLQTWSVEPNLWNLVPCTVKPSHFTNHFKSKPVVLHQNSLTSNPFDRVGFRNSLFDQGMVQENSVHLVKMAKPQKMFNPFEPEPIQPNPFERLTAASPLDQTSFASLFGQEMVQENSSNLVEVAKPKKMFNPFEPEPVQPNPFEEGLALSSFGHIGFMSPFDQGMVQESSSNMVEAAKPRKMFNPFEPEPAQPNSMISSVFGQETVRPNPMTDNFQLEPEQELVQQSLMANPSDDVGLFQEEDPLNHVGTDHIQEEKNLSDGEHLMQPHQSNQLGLAESLLNWMPNPTSEPGSSQAHPSTDPDWEWFPTF